MDIQRYQSIITEKENIGKRLEKNNEKCFNVSDAFFTQNDNKVWRK